MGFRDLFLNKAELSIYISIVGELYQFYTTSIKPFYPVQSAVVLYMTLAFGWLKCLILQPSLSKVLTFFLKDCMQDPWNAASSGRWQYTILTG